MGQRLVIGLIKTGLESQSGTGRFVRQLVRYPFITRVLDCQHMQFIKVGRVVQGDFRRGDDSAGMDSVAEPQPACTLNSDAHKRAVRNGDGKLLSSDSQSRQDVARADILCTFGGEVESGSSSSIGRRIGSTIRDSPVVESRRHDTDNVCTRGEHRWGKVQIVGRTNF